MRAAPPTLPSPLLPKAGSAKAQNVPPPARSPFGAVFAAIRAPAPFACPGAPRPNLPARAGHATGAGAATAPTATPTELRELRELRETSERRGEPRREPSEEPPDLEATRAAFALAPPATPLPAPVASPPPSVPTPGAALDPHLAAELVERAAFWGDGERGLARLRFGHKARAGLAGATVTLEQDGGVLRVRVDEVFDPELAKRLRERLARRGLAVDE